MLLIFQMQTRGDRGGVKIWEKICGRPLWMAPKSCFMVNVRPKFKVTS